VQSDSASPFFRAIPVLVLAATVTTTVMLPVLWAPSRAAQLPLGDAILLLALLALARFLCAIGALDAGGAFGGMGASREMTVGLLVEPALMMAVFSVAVAGGTTDLVHLAARRGRYLRWPGRRRTCSRSSPCWCWPWRKPAGFPWTIPTLTLN